MDGNACASGAVDNDAAVFLLLAGYFQGVDDACQYDDGGSVLIIVENRNV